MILQCFLYNRVIYTVLVMADLIHLTVTSYNCRGFNNSKIMYIQALLSKATVLFLQEHWLADGQLCKLGDIDSNYVFNAVSGFDSTEVLSGRPYGGCAILWRSDIDADIKAIEISSRRICAIRMITTRLRILFINVYMPYEGDEHMTDDFADQLSIIEDIISRNPDCHVIVGGDFNVDFSRTWTHTAMLDSFCTNVNLNVALRHDKCQIDYSYHFNMGRFQVLDHYLLSGTLYNNSIESVHVLHDADNLSDHEPIVLQLQLDVQCVGFADRVHTPCVSWAKATDNDLLSYQTLLNQTLHDIFLPTSAFLCSDIKCSNALHFQQINKFAMDLTNACMSAAEATVPHTCRRQDSGRIAGWSEHVQPLREKSLFWHKMWLDCGRPRAGAVADSMRRTRVAYHYAIRKVKREEENIICEKVADAMLRNNTRDFWSEIKRIRSSKSVNSRTVDNESEPINIAKLFADNYRELYTCVPYDVGEMKRISDDIDCLLLSDQMSHECIFTYNDIKSAVSHLKPHKSDGNSGLSSNHIINASDLFFTHLALLFTAVVIHGRVPDSFLLSTIIPIPKGNNVDKADSSNFRGIALSSLYGKVFDNIVLHRYSEMLVSSELQFGFKAKSSTNLCSMVMKESIAYYVNNNSSVFCTFLDASKAFDRVNYCKLFRLLIDRHVPVCIVRVLQNFYTNNYVRVSWGGIVSDYFLAINGVKQGGVLSPVLFCLYIDGLLVALAQARVGCFIGSYFVGALAYADDIVLLAPSAFALRKMLAICDSYARDFHIVFNAKKSKCLVLFPSARRFLYDSLKSCTFYIGDKPIEFVDSFSHLGHLITNKLTDSGDVLKRRNDFIGQVNNMLCYFRKLTSCVKNKLFKSYCTSLYGCELWLLSTGEIDDLCVAWRKGLRRVWELPTKSHSYLLQILSQCLPLFDEISRRSINFIRFCATHESSLVSFIAQYAVNHARMLSSFIGQNALLCMRRYNFSLHDLFNGPVSYSLNSFALNSVSEEMRSSSSFLFELILLRDNFLCLNGQSDELFAHEELQCLIDYVSTN